MKFFSYFRNSSYILILLLIVSFGAQAQDEVVAAGVDPAVEQGQQIFKNNCRACHGMDRALTGPALDGAFKKVMEAKNFNEEQTYDWMIRWIRNAPQIIASGDEYANQLFQQYGTMMPGFPGLSDEEARATVEYIRNWQQLEQVAQGPGAAGTGTADGQGPGISLNLLLIILVVVLILIALVVTRVTNVLGRVAREVEGEEVPDERPFYLNRKFLALIVLVGIIFIGYYTVKGAIGLGRSQGYEPEQPIYFSHKLHAGINQIDCKYCHVGAERGKQAVIPSVNICMNCHKYVNVGPDGAFKEQHGLQGPGSDTSQIAKIYDYAGFDPATQTYDKTKAEPVEWIRIHNLPDHVYFNHSQHVKVGQIDCRTCHGPVDSIDIMYQYAPLSMGWCINCHRETKVQFTTNSYYDNHYEEFHELMKEGKLDSVTVEMIGGTECQKCHY